MPESITRRAVAYFHAAYRRGMPHGAGVVRQHPAPLPTLLLTMLLAQKPITGRPLSTLPSMDGNNVWVSVAGSRSRTMLPEFDVAAWFAYRILKDAPRELTKPDPGTRDGQTWRSG